MMKINRASLADLEDLTLLFDGYRRFYRQEQDLGGCRDFLEDRITRNEAFIFIAREDDGSAIGFTLLYPIFSSVRRKRVYILNDLFVHSDHRKKGVGERLLRAAANFGKEQGAHGLQLETEISNTKAQSLYENQGWKKVDDVYFYNYTL